MSNDLCDRNYADYINIKKHKRVISVDKEKVIFTKEEISLLWEYKEDPYYQIILILNYTGIRIGELISLKKKI